eukprot:253062-Karenia_brevis.AAC.1
MDIRDKWMGIKLLKSKYIPVPFTRKTHDGEYVTFNNRAEHTARYLSEVQWGHTPLPHHPFNFNFATPHVSNIATRPIT